MSKRFQGGVLGVGFNPLQAPNAPTGVTGTAGNQQVSVALRLRQTSAAQLLAATLFFLAPAALALLAHPRRSL